MRTREGTLNNAAGRCSLSRVWKVAALALAAAMVIVQAGPATAWFVPRPEDLYAFVVGKQVTVAVFEGNRQHTFDLHSKLSLSSVGITRSDVTKMDSIVAQPSEMVTWVLPETVFLPPSGGASGNPVLKAAPAPVPIPIANDADTFDVACDARTAVVVGANSATPVALVDLLDQRQVATVAYAARIARSVAVDDDGRQALVVVDSAPVSTGGAIRRVAIANGTIADTGENLAFSGEYVARVAIAPGAKTGVAVVGGGATRLVAFSVPGLVAKGSVALGNRIGNAIAFSPSGDRVFVRSGQRGATDVIEAFTYDVSTGAIGQVPTLTITDVSGFTGSVYQTSMAISPDGALLVVADENTTGRLPAPRIARFSTATGALVDATALEQDAKPRIVATLRACKSSAVTQALVEFRHAAFDHYFVTGIADEIALLDNGTLAGWARTGEGFNVYASGTPGSAATCRFFSDSFAPKSSHFYTPFAAECATVKANARWTFEGEVFDVALPAADGSCVPPTIPLYRVYNEGQGGAPNHRYTARLDVRATMVAAGWTPEGNGIGVIACVPP